MGRLREEVALENRPFTGPESYSVTLEPEIVLVPFSIADRYPVEETLRAYKVPSFMIAEVLADPPWSDACRRVINPIEFWL